MTSGKGGNERMSWRMRGGQEGEVRWKMGRGVKMVSEREVGGWEGG